MQPFCRTKNAECLPGQRRHSALGNRREPSLLQGQPSPVGAAQDKDDTSSIRDPQLHPRETPTYVPHAPRLSSSHKPLHSAKAGFQSFEGFVSTGLWILFSGFVFFFFNSYFIFYSYSLLMHQALADIKCLVCPEWPFIHRYVLNLFLLLKWHPSVHVNTNSINHEKFLSLTGIVGK